MVHPLRRQGDAGHEAEGLVEIGELESLGDGVAAVHLMPAGEAREGVGALAAVELLRPALVGHIRVPISAVHALRGYVPAMSNPHPRGPFGTAPSIEEMEEMAERAFETIPTGIGRASRRGRVCQYV